MNIIALIATIVGVSLMSLTIYFGNKIPKKWLRYLAAISGVLISLVIMGSISSILGDDSTKTASKAGEYLVYIIVAIAIIKSIFSQNKKITITVLAIIFIAGLGSIFVIFNPADEKKKEPEFYTYIFFEFPNEETTMGIIKRTPKSECEKWRVEYFNASKKQCVGCKILQNECRKIIPIKYLNAFSQKHIGSSYILKPYSYPEITVFENMPEDIFNNLCNIHKKSLNTTQCFM